MADGVGGEKALAPLHAGVLLLTCIGMASYDYVKWYRGLKEKTTGWEFDAVLNEDGVKTYSKVESDAKHPWDYYTGYREYDDYLEIHGRTNQVTFVPKTQELAELVEFTKSKIKKL